MSKPMNDGFPMNVTNFVTIHGQERCLQFTFNTYHEKCAILTKPEVILLRDRLSDWLDKGDTQTMKCPSCNGEGYHFTGIEHTGMQQTQGCSDCEGTGVLMTRIGQEAQHDRSNHLPQM